MLRIAEAIIGLELCEQSFPERTAKCQGKLHASEAARSAVERARYLNFYRKNILITF